MTTTRRLAAIMAADVVGYSRLIEQDETATLAALKERRTGILAPLVAEHHGRIVKVMGDGVLVEFASAVNAVACAVELQKRMAAANDGVGPTTGQRMRIYAEEAGPMAVRAAKGAIAESGFAEAQNPLRLVPVDDNRSFPILQSGIQIALDQSCLTATH